MAADVRTSGTGTNVYRFFPPFPYAVVVVLSCLAVIGIILLISSPLSEMPGRLGVVALVLALVGGLAIGLIYRSTALTVLIDDEGFTISNGGSTKDGEWIDVTDVSATPDGDRIVIRSGPVDRAFVIPPKGKWAEQMSELTDDIVARLP